MACKCIQLERDREIDGKLRFLWKDSSHMAAMVCYGPMGHFQRTVRMQKAKARIIWHQLMKVGWTQSGPAFKLTMANAPQYKQETIELRAID